MKKKICCIIFSILITFSFWAQPSPPPSKDAPMPPPSKGTPLPPPPREEVKSYHGKRVGDNQKSGFYLVGVRILKGESPVTYVDLYFNGEINPDTIKTGEPLLLKSQSGIIMKPTSFQYSKNCKGIRFIFTEPYERIEHSDMKIEGVRSWDNCKMPMIELYDIELDSQYHYSKEEKQWKKS